MWNAQQCGLKPLPQRLAALSLIAAGLIRPDPIIKTSLYHFFYDKKKKKGINGCKESDREIE